MARRRLKPRFYMIVTVAVLFVAGLVYWLWPKNLQTIQQGSIEYDGSFDTVIVRREKVYREENYGKINMLVGEGKTIAKDTKIAEIYQWDYSDRMIDELVGVQTKIYEFQQANVMKDLSNSELDGVHEKINTKLGEIRAVIEGNADQDMLQLEQQLKELKSEEGVILKKLSPKNNNTLNDLYHQETSIQDRINKSKKDAVAEEAGIVSFYFDGAEEALKGDNVENLSKTDISNAIAGKLPAANHDLAGGKAIYRLIDSHQWYATFLGPRDGIKELMLDQEYQVTFEGVYDRPFTAKLTNVRAADGNTIYVLAFDEDVSPLISTRAAKIKMHKSFEGYKIKSGAITEQNGIKGVYAEMPYGKTFVKVSIIVDDGRNAIIEFVDVTMSDPIKIYE